MNQTLRRKRVKTVRIAFRATRMNAYIERFIRTLRNEVLDHFLIFGGKHMDSLLKTFLAYYHRSRPHQGKDPAPGEAQNQVATQSEAAGHDL